MLDFWKSGSFEITIKAGALTSGKILRSIPKNARTMVCYENERLGLL